MPEWNVVGDLSLPFTKGCSVGMTNILIRPHVVRFIEWSKEVLK